MKLPDEVFDEMDVQQLHVGATYDLPATVACVLLLEGWAVTETDGEHVEVANGSAKKPSTGL